MNLDLAEIITMEYVKKVLLVALPINSHHPSQQGDGSVQIFTFFSRTCVLGSLGPG